MECPLLTIHDLLNTFNLLFALPHESQASSWGNWAKWGFMLLCIFRNSNKDNFRQTLFFVADYHYFCPVSNLASKVTPLRYLHGLVHFILATTKGVANMALLVYRAFFPLCCKVWKMTLWKVLWPAWAVGSCSISPTGQWNFPKCHLPNLATEWKTLCRIG